MMPKRGVEAFHIRTQAASLPSCYKHTGPSVFKLKRQEDLIINMDKKGGTSSSVELHNGWLKLWSAKVPRKVKIHLWCICFQRIYVGDELKRRKFIDMVSCPYYFKGEAFITVFGVVFMSGAWRKL